MISNTNGYFYPKEPFPLCLFDDIENLFDDFPAIFRSPYNTMGYWTSKNGGNSLENIPNFLEEFTAGMAPKNLKNRIWAAGKLPGFGI